MSGINLLAKYGITEDDIPENVGRKAVPDGIYDYTVTDHKVYEKDETSWHIIDYDFGDDGQFREWFTVESSDEERVLTSLSFYKKRLASFGQTLADIRFDETIGSTGTLELRTKGKYQNITEFSVDEYEGDDEPAEEPEEPEDTPEVLKTPAAKRRPAASTTGANPFGGKRK